jgi:hypothetical protein
MTEIILGLKVEGEPGIHDEALSSGDTAESLLPGGNYSRDSQNSSAPVHHAGE